VTSDILLALAGNENLLPEHADALIATGDPAVLLELVREQRLTVAQTDLLARRPDLVPALVASGNLPLDRIGDDPVLMLAGVGRADEVREWLPRLAACPDVEVRRGLAAHAGERADIADLIADDADCAVAVGAATLYDLPAAIAARLTPRPEACVRVALAGNEHAPGPFLAGLVAGAPIRPCPHWTDTAAAEREVLSRAVANASTPVGAVEPLLADPGLAEAVARRTDLPAAAYERLVALEIPAVTRRVATNWAAPAPACCVACSTATTATGGRWCS
jgi:hypothetical protein